MALGKPGQVLYAANNINQVKFYPEGYSMDTKELLERLNEIENDYSELQDEHYDLRAVVKQLADAIGVEIVWEPTVIKKEK